MKIIEEELAFQIYSELLKNFERDIDSNKREQVVREQKKFTNTFNLVKKTEEAPKLCIFVEGHTKDISVTSGLLAQYQVIYYGQKDKNILTYINKNAEGEGGSYKRQEKNLLSEKKIKEEFRRIIEKGENEKSERFKYAEISNSEYEKFINKTGFPSINEKKIQDCVHYLTLMINTISPAFHSLFHTKLFIWEEGCRLYKSFIEGELTQGREKKCVDIRFNLERNEGSKKLKFNKREERDSPFSCEKSHQIAAGAIAKMANNGIRALKHNVNNEARQRFSALEVSLGKFRDFLSSSDSNGKIKVFISHAHGNMKMLYRIDDINSARRYSDCFVFDNKRKELYFFDLEGHMHKFESKTRNKSKLIASINKALDESKQQKLINEATINDLKEHFHPFEIDYKESSRIRMEWLKENLYDPLKEFGFDVTLDFITWGAGEDMNKSMKKLKKPNTYILPIIDEIYVEKTKQESTGVYKEYKYTLHMMKKKKNRVIPIKVDKSDSYPEGFNVWGIDNNAKEEVYSFLDEKKRLETIFKIIKRIVSDKYKNNKEAMAAIDDLGEKIGAYIELINFNVKAKDQFIDSAVKQKLKEIDKKVNQKFETLYENYNFYAVSSKECLKGDDAPSINICHKKAAGSRVSKRNSEEKIVLYVTGIGSELKELYLDTTKEPFNSEEGIKLIKEIINWVKKGKLQRSGISRNEKLESLLRDYVKGQILTENDAVSPPATNNTDDGSPTTVSQSDRQTLRSDDTAGGTPTTNNSQSDSQSLQSDDSKNDTPTANNFQSDNQILQTGNSIGNTLTTSDSQSDNQILQDAEVNKLENGSSSTLALNTQFLREKKPISPSNLQNSMANELEFKNAQEKRICDLKRELPELRLEYWHQERISDFEKRVFDFERELPERLMYSSTESTLQPSARPIPSPVWKKGPTNHSSDMSFFQQKGSKFSSSGSNRSKMLSSNTIAENTEKLPCSKHHAQRIEKSYVRGQPNNGIGISSSGNSLFGDGTRPSVKDIAYLWEARSSCSESHGNSKKKFGL